VAAHAEELAQIVAPMERGAQVGSLEGEARFAPEGPEGRGVLRADGAFSARIDLRKRSVDPRDFDLLKVQVKADRGAFLRFSLENFPNPGELSHWYVLDAMRGPFGWGTLWLDLRRPEEVRLPGQYKGMAAEDPSLRGLQLSGSLRDTRRQTQQPGHSMWIGPIRLVRKAVDLDWDQREAPHTWGDGEDLVFTYPLTVANRLQEPITVNLWLLPFEVEHAFGRLAVERVELGAGERRLIEARVGLPAEAAARLEPLYCERFEARASAEGIEDSDVTILRSADPIHLTVTVPIPEDKLTFPFLPRRSDLPESILGFEADVATQWAERLTPDALDEAMSEKGIETGESAGVVTAGASSAAFLYDFTGEEGYREKVRDVLVRMAELYPQQQRELYGQEYQIISHGILARNTLQFCFKFGGTQRPPYNYGGSSGNDACGRMHGIMNAFDLVAADLARHDRERIINDLLLPAGIQCRNHYIGPGNQQLTDNYVVMYAGLAARNWPLVSFAHSSEHGLLGNLKWAFDDDGLCLEGHYQSYTINPILWMTELLYGRGIDLYGERLYDIIHSRGAEAIGAAYSYPIIPFLDEQRFVGKGFLAERKTTPTDGYHLTGSTLLKWGEVEVSMNWGTHIYRSSHDRCALWVRTPKRGGDKDLRRLAVGGGSYNHSSFGQSVIIVDEQLQTSRPASVVSYDVEGPVQHVMAVSDEHYPGSTVTRTFALLDRHVLVMDRVVNDKPRTVDWCLKDAGKDLSLALEARAGSWTTKPNDNRIGVTFGANVDAHAYGQTDATWTEGDGRLTMLGAPGSEILAFQMASRPQLMVRRAKTKQTDFVAFISTGTKSIEPVPVRRADGQAADAVGVRITLQDGRTFRAVASYEAPGTEVLIEGLKTDQRFGTDYESRQ
jgi:hypothetical protein